MDRNEWFGIKWNKYQCKEELKRDEKGHKRTQKEPNRQKRAKKRDQKRAKRTQVQKLYKEGQEGRHTNENVLNVPNIDHKSFDTAQNWSI